MNQRVKDIIERTRAYVPDTAAEAFLEKFAEMVVLECEAEIVNWIGSEDGQLDAGLQKAASTIVECFEVMG